MSSLSLPNTFTNNVSYVDAVPLQANMTAIQTAVNSIDHTNMGAAGIYATSLIPTTTGQGTFGGITAGVGYTFLASDKTSVPLTISGVSSQSADIFDVTLTSGGTKALWVASGGALNVGSNASATNPGVINVANGASSGIIFIGGGTRSIQIDYGSTAVNTLTMNDTSGLCALSLGPGSSNASGQLNLSAGTNYNQLSVRSADTPSGTAVAGTGFSFRVNGNAEMCLSSAGALGIAGALTQGSLRAMKRDITPLSRSALDLIKAVDWVEFNYAREEEGTRRHIGYVADDTDEFLSGKDHQEGFEVGSIAALACAAIKELLVREEARGAATL